MAQKAPRVARNILVLVPEAYLGQGGIARQSRDVIAAMCADPDVERVVALPRIVGGPAEPMPDKLNSDHGAAGGIPRYAAGDRPTS